MFSELIIIPLYPGIVGDGRSLSFVCTYCAMVAIIRVGVVVVTKSKIEIICNECNAYLYLFSNQGVRGLWLDWMKYAGCSIRRNA